jgi:hypothetical protein
VNSRECASSSTSTSEMDRLSTSLSWRYIEGLQGLMNETVKMTKWSQFSNANLQVIAVSCHVHTVRLLLTPSPDLFMETCKKGNCPFWGL